MSNSRAVETGLPLRRISRNGVSAIANVIVGVVSGLVLIPVMLDDAGRALIEREHSPRRAAEQLLVAYDALGLLR